MTETQRRRSSGGGGQGRGGPRGGGRSGGPGGRRGGPGGRRGGRDEHRREGPAAHEADISSVEEEDEDVGIPMEECAFAEYDLHVDLVRALAGAGYRTPSPIQARTLPPALEGRDIIGQARTGTGKTAAFLVPALQLLSDKSGPRVLIVVPTRELALQVAREAQKLGRFLGVKSTAIYGGDSMARQVQDVNKGAQIIAATPGRLLDHLGRGTLKLDDLDVLILDEADRMFDLGFRDDIARIISKAPKRRQTMLFSATISDEVMAISARYMNKPTEIFLAPDKMTVEEVHQTFFPVDQSRKTLLLLKVLANEKPERSIIFMRTKHGADRLAETLQKKGLPASEIHSGLPQKKRERILKGFREGLFTYLIATDVAARGLDIEDVSHVINFDIPENAEDYVHRIGRTARMGKEGRAATFVTPDDGDFLTAIEKLINQEIVMERYDDFTHTTGGPAATPEKPKGPSYTRTLQGYVRSRARR
jgi:ATP-dependent RNA helicase DeaD